MPEPTDMHCDNCDADVFSPDIETYTVIRWNPETGGNEFKLVWCSYCWNGVVMPYVGSNNA